MPTPPSPAVYKVPTRLILDRGQSCQMFKRLFHVEQGATYIGSIARMTVHWHEGGFLITKSLIYYTPARDGY